MSRTFDAQLEEAFRAADVDRDKIKVFKRLARQDPAAAAEAVCEGIPLLMERSRNRASEAFGVDIAATDWKDQFKQKPHTIVEAGLLLMMANDYLVCSWCKTKLDAYAADKALSNEERAEKVCEVGVEALRATEAVLQHNLQEIVAAASEDAEAEAYAKNALALRLVGGLATRISVRRNKSLEKALDDLRERNKPARREQFEILLRELYVRAPKIWAEHHVTDWQLQVTRNAVVKEIAPRRSPQTEEVELAAFAEREALLKKAREAALTPREYELFGLVVSDPERFLRNGKLNHSEAAREMGVAVGTIKSLWSRTRKTLKVS
jgi:hypothetical protein